MSTTIQVNEDTVDYLKLLRDQYKAASYDILIKMLMKKAMKPEKSMAGVGGKLSKEKIMEGLRDKSDRF